MRCQLCGKNEGYFEGVVNREVLLLCEICAKTEGVPLIRKPTSEQLARANQRYTVRERMMRISGLDKLNPVSRDHEIAQRHLGKIKIPEKPQQSASLVDNYTWNIKMARRRKKMSQNQIAQVAGISVEAVDSFERGILIKDYEKIAEKLENALGIPILKSHQKSIKFIMPEKKEQANLPITVNGKDKSLEELELDELRKSVHLANQHKVREEKIQAVEEIKKGDFNFSDKTKTGNITLDDLIKAKKEREAKQRKMEEDSKSLFGDDIELE